MAQRARLSDYESLTVPEKVLRLQDLWDELASEADGLALTAEQKRELDKRLKAFRASPSTGSPWPVVLKRIRGRR